MLSINLLEIIKSSLSSQPTNQPTSPNEIFPIKGNSILQRKQQRWRHALTSFRLSNTRHCQLYIDHFISVETLRQGAQQLTGNEGSYLPNCKTNLVIFLHALYQLFWHFKNTTAHHLGRYEPSSPCAKELHDCSLLKILRQRCLLLMSYFFLSNRHFHIVFNLCKLIDWSWIKAKTNVALNK